MELKRFLLIIGIMLLLCTGLNKMFNNETDEPKEIILDLGIEDSFNFDGLTNEKDESISNKEDNNKKDEASEERDNNEAQVDKTDENEGYIFKIE